MSFQEVLFLLPRADVEAWSDQLLEQGCLAVSAEDADADSVDEQPIFGEPDTLPEIQAWERTQLIVLLAEGDDPAQHLIQAAQTLGKNMPTYKTRVVADADWVRLTQSQYTPIPVGQRLLISPSWVESSDSEKRLRIVVDPGLAFGTGSHPTTHLCLNWLEDFVIGGETVIDYGCGSGILAIAAKRLGAGKTFAIDIDPQALIATESNARINHVALNVQSTSAAMPPPARIVVANILASPLKLLAPLLIGLVAPGGRLALSGVLERQVEEVAAVYHQQGLAVHAYRIHDGWACLHGCKK